MIFFFFAVGAVTHFFSVKFTVCNRSHNTKRDSFVSRSEQYVKIIAVSVMDCFCIIFTQFIASPVVGLFTSDQTVIAFGSQYICGYIFDCFFAGIHFCFSGYFCAYGKSGISFFHNIVAILCVRIPGAYLTSKWFPQTLFPMGIATACGSLLSALICIAAFYLSRRRLPLYK